MSKVVFLVKIILAGVVAVLFLSAFFFFYSTTPVHISNPIGESDYIWPANSIWVKMGEGISFGRFDSNGYNNLDVIENPDILILGSSHMEATNIMQEETVVNVLNKAFHKVTCKVKCPLNSEFKLNIKQPPQF